MRYSGAAQGPRLVANFGGIGNRTHVNYIEETKLGTRIWGEAKGGGSAPQIRLVSDARGK